LRQRADVRAAEYQVAAALARADQAEPKRWPAFSIGGSLSLSALTLSALTNGASVLGTLLASVNWPVLDGGAALAQVLHRHLGRPLGRHGSAPHNHSMTPCPTSVPAAPQAPSAPVPAPAAKPRASGPAGEQVDLKALLGDTAARPWCRRGWLWAGVALPPAAADI